MEKILAQRFAFCDFSQIVGFPNALPHRDQWEDFLSEFHAASWEELAEHLLDFHEAIHRHHITHEDVQIKLFRYSLKGAALEWCRSLPTASIRSLIGFHTAFNSFCKDYCPTAGLYENCCEEFSLLHEAFTSPADHVCDEALTVEESICCEKIEALNDMSGVSLRMEASDIISDAFVLLDVHKDQHASCGDYEFVEQMWSMVGGSPKCRIEADIPSNLVSEDGDLPICKELIIVEEVSSLFLQGVSHDICLPGINKEKITCEQPEAAGPTVPETDIFDEITILEESQQEEEKEPEGQSAFCLEPVSEQPPPEISEPTSIIHPPVVIRDIQPQVNSCVAEEGVCRPFSGSCHSFYDPVCKYMEWHFPYALEPPYFISTPACKEELKSVTVLLSRLHHLLVIIDRRKELLSRKLLEWLWWKFSFT
jgi:hypothetical protein